MMQKKWKVALVGYYGFGNLGDELLATSAVRQLESLGVLKDEIVILTASPEFYRALGVECVNRWNLRDVFSALRQSETLLLGGGGIFQNVTSLRSCLYYWGLIKIARLVGATPWAVGQSIGPFFGSFSKALARNALSKCKLIEVRDEMSKRAAHELGLEDVSLGEDLVFTLKPEQSASGDVLLVNFRRWKGIDEFILAVRDYVHASTRECLGVAMAPDDLAFMREIRDKYKINFSDITLVDSWDEVCRVWRRAGGALGMRLHFSLLSLLFRAPQMLFPYDPKVLSFAARWGIPTWNERTKNLSPACATVPLGDVNEIVTANFARHAKKVMSI